MTLARKVPIASILLLAATLGALPAIAGDFALHGAYWDTDEADKGLGGGVRFAGALGKVLELEFRASYFGDLTHPLGPVDYDLKAVPLEVGLSFNIAREHALNPFFGGGFGYYFLNSNLGEIDDELGWYLDGGLELGDANGPSLLLEVIYRNMGATVENAPGDFPGLILDPDEEIELKGIGANVGIVWRF